MLVGVLVGALAGRRAAAAERHAAWEAQIENLSHLRHDLRRSLTIIRGEVELILSQDHVPAHERRCSSESIITEVERVDHLLKN